MHTVTISGGPYYAGDLIAFTTGFLITLLLLVLTVRAAKLPGTPRANVVFAFCALLWTFGGLIYGGLRASGRDAEDPLALAAQAIQFTGIAFFPVPVLAIWRPFAIQPWQKKGAAILRIFGWLFAAFICFLMWSRPLLGAWWLPFVSLHYYVAMFATLMLVFGAVFSLRPKTVPRALYVPSMVMVYAVSISTTSVFIAHSHMHGPPGMVVGGIASHLILVIVLSAFFLFARFRLADVFIRYGIRILLAGLWAAFLAFLAQSPMLVHIAAHASAPGAVHIFAVMIVANALLLSFTFVDEKISTLVNRWLFRAPDYRTERNLLATRLRQLSSQPEVAAATEAAARGPLELSAARLVPIETLDPHRWPPGILEGELVELEFADPLQSLLPVSNVEVMLPISSAGRISDVLLISPGPERPRLVSHDLDYLRAIAIQCGHRLDALRREDEAVERQSREALLQQQVTEAELRALRAQINPHFLFNSLNTVADLIVRDPPRAEAMTLRLASVFRHVLAHSARPLTTIRDEIDFLRTYLHIEEARFGDRLQVHFDVAPDVLHENMPSLILQPLVENALKHGLGPKPGPGHLWISAEPIANQVRLRVEDDGMGPPRNGGAAAPGLGLANVAERLRTLYHDRAGVTLEPRSGGGTRVTVLIPRGQPVAGL